MAQLQYFNIFDISWSWRSRSARSGHSTRSGHSDAARAAHTAGAADAVAQQTQWRSRRSRSSTCSRAEAHGGRDRHRRIPHHKVARLCLHRLQDPGPLDHQHAGRALQGIRLSGHEGAVCTLWSSRSSRTLLLRSPSSWSSAARIHFEDMEAQHVKALAFNVLKDTCPSLTRSWPSSAKGFTTGTRRR